MSENTWKKPKMHVQGPVVRQNNWDRAFVRSNSDSSSKLGIETVPTFLIFEFCLLLRFFNHGGMGHILRSSPSPQHLDRKWPWSIKKVLFGAWTCEILKNKKLIRLKHVRWSFLQLYQSSAPRSPQHREWAWSIKKLFFCAWTCEILKNER